MTPRMSWCMRSLRVPVVRRSGLMLVRVMGLLHWTTSGRLDLRMRPRTRCCRVTVVVRLLRKVLLLPVTRPGGLRVGRLVRLLTLTRVVCCSCRSASGGFLLKVLPDVMVRAMAMGVVSRCWKDLLSMLRRNGLIVLRVTVLRLAM